MPVKATAHKIDNLKVYCPNSQNGCQATPAIEDCELHLSQDNPDGCLYTIFFAPMAVVKIYSELVLTTMILMTVSNAKKNAFTVGSMAGMWR